jgi:hypothetical protein
MIAGSANVQKYQAIRQPVLFQKAIGVCPLSIYFLKLFVLTSLLLQIVMLYRQQASNNEASICFHIFELL